MPRGSRVCSHVGGGGQPQTARDLAFWRRWTLSKGEPWVTEKPHWLWPIAVLGEMRRPRSTSPVGSYSCSVTSGTRKSPMENHRLELLPRHPLVCVSRGCCLLHLSSELWAEVVRPSPDISPSSNIPYWSGGRGMFRESLWDFLVGSLIVSCLFAVWSGAVGWGVLGMLA